MNRVVVASSVVAVILALAVGLWHGFPSSRLQGELQDAQTNAVRLGQQVDELRAQKDRTEADLRAERARAQAAEADLRREKEISAQLHLLVSNGRK
jgi:Copper transport outer membrane protein, MctB